MRARNIGCVIFAIAASWLGIVVARISDVMSSDDVIIRVANSSDKEVFTSVNLKFSGRGGQSVNFSVQPHSYEERKIQVLGDGGVEVFVDDGVIKYSAGDYLTVNLKIGLLHLPVYELTYNGSSLSAEWHSSMDWLEEIYPD